MLTLEILHLLLSFHFGYHYGVYAYDLEGQYNFSLLRHQPYYYKISDINIGIIAQLSDKSTYPNLCKGRSFPTAWALIKSCNYALDFINKHENILPNNKLGMILVDNCQDNGVSAASAVAFRPEIGENSTGAQCNEQSSVEASAVNIFGLATSMNSPSSLTIASIIESASLPWVESYSTNDRFSDKKLFPHFFRVVQPDRFMVRAMLRFIADQGWSYISVIYPSKGFGFVLFNEVKMFIKEYGICIATSYKININTIFEEVAERLLIHKKARVVLAFYTPNNEIVDYFKNHNYQNYFIWVSTFYLNPNSWTHDPNLIEAISGSFDVAENIHFTTDYLKYMRVNNVQELRNPMAQRYWNYIKNCSISNGDCTKDKLKKEDNDFRGAQLADAVLALAHAADTLIKNHCPNATGTEATKCIARYDLRPYLKRVSFQGISVKVEFDEKEEVKGPFAIRQLHYNYERKKHYYKIVAIYHTDNDSLVMQEQASWGHLKGTVRRYGSPKSNFNTPCNIKQYKLTKYKACSWDCITCRENEIVVNDSLCSPCPIYETPDSKTLYKTCKSKPINIAELSYPKIIFLFLLIFILNLFTIYIIVMFNILRNKIHLQEKFWPTLTTQMLAILIGYLTVMLIQITPSSFICKTVFFLFFLSFSLLYCPMLLKLLTMLISIKANLSTKTDGDTTHPISASGKLILTFSLFAIQVRNMTYLSYTYIIYI